MTIRSWTSSGEVAFTLGKQWRSREKQEVSQKKFATRSELQEATKVSYKKSTAWRCVQRWHCDSGIGHQSLWFRGDHEDAIRWLSFWMFSTKTLATDAYRSTLTDVASTLLASGRHLASANLRTAATIGSTYRRYPSNEMKQLCKWANIFVNQFFIKIPFRNWK